MDIKKLASQLGLSSTTISRVLSGQATRYRIAQATQDRVLQAARRKNLVINQTARSLRLNVSQVIGLIVPDISNPFFATLARTVEQTARSRHYSVLLCDSQESIEIEKQNLALMESRGVDGLVIAPVSGDGAHLLRLSKQGKPAVLVDRVPADLRINSVVVNNFEAAREGVLRFRSFKHEAIACLRGNPQSFVDRERYRGYQTAMQESGLPLREDWVAGGNYQVESGRDGMEKLLLAQHPPTALLAFGNLLALGALEILRERKIQVPHQISIISFDWSPWASLISPPLTTISQPAAALGETAVEMLFEGLGDQKKGHRRVVLPYTIIDRESVA